MTDAKVMQKYSLRCSLFERVINNHRIVAVNKKLIRNFTDLSEITLRSKASKHRILKREFHVFQYDKHGLLLLNNCGNLCTYEKFKNQTQKIYRIYKKI